MRLLRLFKPQPTDRAWTTEELKSAFDAYTDTWPIHNDTYATWKPQSVLSRSKPLIKSALKWAYARWPEPISWTVFSAFYIEFVDLGNYLDAAALDAIGRLRNSRILEFGEESTRDPLLMLQDCGDFMMTREEHLEALSYISNHLSRSKAWDPVDLNDEQLDDARKVLIACRAEVASLCAEWDYYIHSICRQEYVQ